MRGRSSREKCILVMGMIVVLCLLGSAVQAIPKVTLDMRDYGDGTYDLYASSSLGDNFGIVYFNIELINILTAVHQSPVAFSADVGGMVGFDGARADLSGPGALFANQTTNSGNAPANLIYGIGQTAGTFPGTIFSDVGMPWLAPVQLCSGTYDTEGDAPEYVLGVDTVANVFAILWTVDEIPQGLAVQAEVVPEPATMVILALGAGLMVTLRRRR